MCRVFLDGVTKMKKSTKFSKCGSKFFAPFLMGLRTLLFLVWRIFLKESALPNPIGPDLGSAKADWLKKVYTIAVNLMETFAY